MGAGVIELPLNSIDFRDRHLEPILERNACPFGGSTFPSNSYSGPEEGGPSLGPSNCGGGDSPVAVLIDGLSGPKLPRKELGQLAHEKLRGDHWACYCVWGDNDEDQLEGTNKHWC